MKEYYFMHKDHMSDAEIVDLYYGILSDGFGDILFYSGGTQNPDDWLDFVKLSTTWLVRVTHKSGQPVGLFWLNGFQGHTAQMHFAVRRGWPDKLGAGRASVGWVAEKTELESLYGCTPKPFKHAIVYAKKVGFVMGHELPGACYIAKKDKYVPGVTSVLDLTIFREGN
jgi:hypothetical protein